MIFYQKEIIININFPNKYFCHPFHHENIFLKTVLQQFALTPGERTVLFTKASMAVG